MEKSKTWKSLSQVNTRICCSSSTLWSITGYEWTVHAIVSLENNMFRVHRSSAHRCFATRSVGTSIATVHPIFTCSRDLPEDEILSRHRGMKLGSLAFRMDRGLSAGFQSFSKRNSFLHRTGDRSS